MERPRQATRHDRAPAGSQAGPDAGAETARAAAEMDQRHSGAASGEADDAGAPGHVEECADRAARPSRRLRAATRRPGRSGRDRVDVGDLRGGREQGQGPPGARRRSRRQDPAGPDALVERPNAPTTATGSASDRGRGTARAGPAGSASTGCSTSPRPASAARARCWSGRSSTRSRRGWSPSTAGTEPAVPGGPDRYCVSPARYPASGRTSPRTGTRRPHRR